MGEYFRHARAAVRAPRTRPPHGDAGAGPQRLAPCRPALRDHAGRRPFPRSDARGRAGPALWLELFRLALSNGCAVSEQALSCIEQNVERYSADDFLATEADRQLVRSCCYPRPGLYARLSEMHDCGLLDRVFPEFAPDSLPRHPRLSSQIHGRRAHAADDSQYRVAVEPGNREPPALRFDPPGGARARSC